MSEARLSVRNLTTAFHTEHGTVRVVDGVSFQLPAGRTVALIGESGAGKSVTALSILRLVPDPPGSVTATEIRYRDRNLLNLSERAMARVRGAEIAMIFQEPTSSLDPVRTIGAQILRVLRIHRLAQGRRARARAIEVLDLVGIPSPEAYLGAFPHQLAAGMRQRVLIAMALACGPAILIADEPTAALDAATTIRVLQLLQRLQNKLGMSVLWITGDLDVVPEFAHDVLVMYAGRVLESGPVERVFERPCHPYTESLLACVPPSRSERRPRRLMTIEGVAPNPMTMPSGCAFAPRCATRSHHREAAERCHNEEPTLRTVQSGHSARCHFAVPDQT